jgi:hypothetical protein
MTTMLSMRLAAKFPATAPAYPKFSILASFTRRLADPDIINTDTDTDIDIDMHIDSAYYHAVLSSMVERLPADMSVLLSSPQATSTSEAERPSSLEELPTELVLEITGYLSAKDLCSVALACPKFGCATRNQRLAHINLPPLRVFGELLKGLCIDSALGEMVKRLCITSARTVEASEFYGCDKDTIGRLKKAVWALQNSSIYKDISEGLSRKINHDASITLLLSRLPGLQSLEIIRTGPTAGTIS